MYFQSKLIAHKLNPKSLKRGLWCEKRKWIFVSIKITEKQLLVDSLDRKSTFFNCVRDIINEKKYLLLQLIGMNEVVLKVAHAFSKSVDKMGQNV